MAFTPPPVGAPGHTAQKYGPPVSTPVKTWASSSGVNPPSSDLYGGLTGANRDAAVLLTSLFTSYGLGTLAPVIVGYLKQGYAADTVSVLLQSTKEYEQRFAGNAQRLKEGLPVLSPAEYLSTEKAYASVLQKWGLPKGFYDSPTDFTSFIGNDVSAQELDQRAQQASDFVNQADGNEMSFYKSHYTDGDIIAFALDPKRAAPLVGKAFAAARIGGQAADQGINIDQSQAESLANLGITQGQAQQGFGAIAQEQPTVNKLGSIYGDQVTTQDLIDAAFKSDAEADNKVKKLASQERGSFGGGSGNNLFSLASENNL